jgi:hypothetical protein
MTINREERLLFGHLWAVGGASVLLLIGWSGKSIIDDFMLASFSPGRFLLWIILNLLVLFFYWLLCAAFTWITAVIPIVVVFLTGEKFRIRSIFFYLASGALFGVLATPVFTARGGIVPDLALYGAWIADVPLVASCGAFGGFLYWWKAGRWAGAAPTSSGSAV